MVPIRTAEGTSSTSSNNTMAVTVSVLLLSFCTALSDVALEIPIAQTYGKGRVQQQCALQDQTQTARDGHEHQLNALDLRTNATLLSSEVPTLTTCTRDSEPEPCTLRINSSRRAPYTMKPTLMIRAIPETTHL